MFLKHRNLTAWILLVLSALCWIYGLGIAPFGRNAATSDTSAAETTLAVIITGESSIAETTVEASQQGPQSQRQNTVIIRGLLIFCAAAASIVSVFFLRQKSPALGADGILLALAALGWMYFRFAMRNRGGEDAFYSFFMLFAILFSIQELWGWLLSHMSLSWCMSCRLSERAAAPQISLLVYVGWIIVSAVVSLLTFMDFYNLYYPMSVAAYRIHIWFVCLLCTSVSVILDVCCLWRYGSDLAHFQKQLDNFQKAQPITVKDGAFSQTETQLLEVQRQHEEAVHTAVS
ncbi:MAG: hypothetical protein IKL87_06360, partial [Oscillospiraceae bacterium]|nr:hypothetical protein [Oscillospiraceae bacterium]